MTCRPRRVSNDVGEQAGVMDVDVVVEEEVLIVVAADRSGHSVLIEMHRLIFHADDSPCSHFSSTHQPQHTPQADSQVDSPGMWQTDMSSVDSSTQQPAATSYMPLVEEVVMVVVLVLAVVLLLATMTIACVMRHKRRQQRVLIEPPTIEQLGLDVPMLSSSPTVSASRVLQL